MRSAGHVALCERGETCTGFWWRNLKVRGNLGDPGLDGRVILRWTFRMWDVVNGLDRAGSGYGELAGICECGNAPSGSTKCGLFLD